MKKFFMRNNCKDKIEKLKKDIDDLFSILSLKTGLKLHKTFNTFQKNMNYLFGQVSPSTHSNRSRILYIMSGLAKLSW